MTQAPTWAVLGGGSFGTAIANILAANGQPTYLWMRDPVNADICQRERENARYLPGYRLVDELTVTADLARAFKHSQVVFLSAPSHGFRAMAQDIRPLLRADAMVISAAEGIEQQGFTLMSQILEQELPAHRYGVLSGHNFAKETVARQHTGTVIASEHPEVTRSEEHTSELQSRGHLVCRLLLEKKKKKI